jgi:ribosome-associated protein
VSAIHITPEISIDENEIREDFVRASGPGGQNVNKVSTAVQVRFNCARSPGLDEGTRRRLGRLAGRRLTVDGHIVLRSERFRRRELNRRDALQRLIDLIRKAAHRPVKRKPTRRSAASNERRLESKRRRGGKKRSRNFDIHEHS